jgi:hypothetical protein
MPESSAVSLQISNDPEKTLCWGDFPSPEMFLKWLQSRMFISGESITSSNNVVSQHQKPGAADAANLWVKTSKPVGIGYFIDGEWEMFYQYPTDTPFIWPSINGNIPDGTKKLTNSEIANLGLAVPKESSWIILPEPAI